MIQQEGTVGQEHEERPAVEFLVMNEDRHLLGSDIRTEALRAMRRSFGRVLSQVEQSESRVGQTIRTARKLAELGKDGMELASFMTRASYAILIKRDSLGRLGMPPGQHQIAQPLDSE